MLPHERNLMISLCLGLQLKGDESPSELESLIAEVSANADLVSVQPTQTAMAEWLGVTLEDYRNQKSASVFLWDDIDAKGYGLVDVPTKIRRPAFGGSTEIQKRHARGSRFGHLVRRLGERLVALAILTALAGAAWYFWKSRR